MYLLPENTFAPVSCALVAVMLSCYQRHVVRYQSLPQNSKMGLLTRLFEITGHSYPSFSSIRHGGSTGNSLGKLEKKNMFKLQKSVTKVFFGCLVAAKKMIFRLILREKKIFFFRVFPKRCQSIRHDETKRMRGMSDLLSRKTLSGSPLLSFVSSLCLFCANLGDIIGFLNSTFVKVFSSLYCLS